jgi:RNA polymerase sigma-70 factor (ECF subfamily)
MPARDNRELFEALVRQHERQIYRVAFRLAGSQEEAQDLVQDALLEAFRDFGRFEPGSRFDRWIFRIMSNTQIDKVRRRGRLVFESLDTPWDSDEGGAIAREIPDTAAGPEERLLQNELEAPLQRALDALPPDFRAVVILSDIEGMTYEEISATLRCPIGTVRSRLSRARNLMRRLLGPHLRQLFGT